jgi:predicted AAA+ superfamily ATPase
MGDRKAVVVKGARQVGKTTLLKSLFGKVAKIQSAGASNAIEDID